LEGGEGQDKVIKDNLIMICPGWQNAGSVQCRKNWVTNEEAAIIIEYAIEVANQGHGLSLQRLEEHANEILRV
jgi:hypothetical protein